MKELSHPERADTLGSPAGEPRYHQHARYLAARKGGQNMSRHMSLPTCEKACGE